MAMFWPSCKRKLPGEEKCHPNSSTVSLVAPAGPITSRGASVETLGEVANRKCVPLVPLYGQPKRKRKRVGSRGPAGGARLSHHAGGSRCSVMEHWHLLGRLAPSSMAAFRVQRWRAALYGVQT